MTRATPAESPPRGVVCARRRRRRRRGSLLDAVQLAEIDLLACLMLACVHSKASLSGRALEGLLGV